MAHTLNPRDQHRRRFSFDSLSLLELVVFVPLAGVLALWLVPKWFDIQWSCVGAFGSEGSTTGDEFSDTVAVLGTFGWILVLIAVLFAQIAERPRLAALLPALWFVVLVGGAMLAALAIGPAPCPS